MMLSSSESFVALEPNLNVYKEQTSWKKSGFPWGLFDFSLC